MKILIVDDEIKIREVVKEYAKVYEFECDEASDGLEAIHLNQLNDYDCIILDIMMPYRSGLEVLKMLRREGRRTPVLLLTARSEVEDRITGFDSGADDYLPKPFDMGELLARVRAMLRRKEDYTPSVLTFGNISLDSRSFELKGKEGSVSLPKLEYQLMELLMLNKGIYLSTEDILVKVWGYDTDVEIGIVWVYISYLRKKLAELNADIVIKAKRNIGYTLEIAK